MKTAFYYERPELGELGKQVFKLFQRWVKMPYHNKKRSKPKESSDFNSKAQTSQNDPLATRSPSIDPTEENGIWDMVLNRLAKVDYNRKSDRFKRLVHHENKLLALYSAIDKFAENPFKIANYGLER